jgi:L,D-transpeptidase catalytic domain
MKRTDARLLLPTLALCVLLVPVGPATAAAKPRRPAYVPALRVVVERAYTLNARRIALQHQRVRFRGIVRRYTPGQVMNVRVLLGKRRYVSVRRTVRQSGGRGVFAVELKAHRRGKLRAFATGGGLRARSRSVDVIKRNAGAGESGLHVVFLQHRLRDVRYLVNFSGVYDGSTSRAVMAYRKVTGMDRSYSANSAIFDRLAHKRGRFVAKYPRHGKHVEADLSRQVLALFDRNGKLFRVLIMSSGKPSTPTVRGSFRVYSKTPGTNSKGMLNSNYFVGGYAIHGYPDVPDYAASHGCLRIPIPNARFMFRWLDYGDRVDVYR